MRAQLKSLSSDFVNLETFSPEDPTNFELYIQLKIGAIGIESADDFGCRICTPKWLMNKISKPFLLRHLIIMPQYDFKELEKTILNYVDGVNGDSWPKIAEKLGRVFAWEFEDYR